MHRLLKGGKKRPDTAEKKRGLFCRKAKEWKGQVIKRTRISSQGQGLSLCLCLYSTQHSLVVISAFGCNHNKHDNDNPGSRTGSSEKNP